MRIKTQVDFFDLYPPLPLLRAYAYADTIGCRIEHVMSRVGFKKQELLRKQRDSLRHNIRVVEYDLAFWATRAQLSFKDMLDSHIMHHMFDEYSNQSFPNTEEALWQSENLIRSFLKAGDCYLESEYLDIQMAHILKRMTQKYHYGYVPNGYTFPKQWRLRSLRWYLTLFPLDVFRLPLVTAICMTRFAQGKFWNSRMESFYGAGIEKFFPTPSKKVSEEHSTSSDLQHLIDCGEDWRDTIGTDWTDTLSNDDDFED